MRRIVLLLVAGVIAATAFLLLVEGPEPITVKVKNLRAVQSGFDLIITWDAMDCNGYDLVVMCDDQRITVNTEENKYVVKDIIFDKTYRVNVSARLKSGYNSRDAKTKRTTHKLNQNMKLSINRYDGFKGDKFRIRVKGKGDVSFESQNKKTAKVNEKGVVTLKKPGQVNIKVTSSGDAMYAEAKDSVMVNVYPESLQQPSKPTVKNISDTRCEITWEPVDFASHYKLYKKNAHTKEFRQFRNIDRTETSVEITRDNGEYAIEACNEIQDKAITSPLSDPVNVTGTSVDAKSYSSSKTLMKLDSSNMNIFRRINGDGSTKVPQSISQTNDCYVVSYVNHAGSQGKLVSYRKSDGECVSIVPCSNMGHANGTTYNPNTNKFYVVKTHRSIRTKSCSTYDGTTKESVETFNLPRVTSGIAYDESNDCYYLSKGNEIYVCNSDFEVQKFIHKRIRYNHAQDIGAYNGVVLVCTWKSGNTSYLDLYRASDGAYLGGYDVSIGEIESCVVDDGYLVILMNTIGSSKDIIYKTKERIALP